MFATLDDDSLALVAGYCRLIAYGDGERIFRQDDPAQSMFIVCSGSVRIRKTDTGRGSSVIAELVEGETIGELELLNRSRWNAAGHAVGATRVLAFPGPGVPLERALGRHPHVAARILAESLRLVAGRIRRANALVRENSPWVQEVRRQVYGDKLTGLYNRSYLEETLPTLLQPGSSVSLLMFKPDNFKLINDTYGHDAGDRVLRMMADGLRPFVAANGFAARYMGNELALVLPGCDRPAAGETAGRLRVALNTMDLTAAIPADWIRLTASFGVAVYPEHGTDAAAIIDAAHALPLVGRARGGNVILFPEDA